MCSVTITIPGDPVGKGRARSTSKGIHYTPEKTRNYEAFVKVLAMEAMNKVGLKPFAKACYAYICVRYALPKSASKKAGEQMLNGIINPTKKPDIDNIVKAVFDALNGIVFEDDKQVVSLSVVKMYDEIAYTRVCVEEIE